jgi:DNA uptake protein ComE-like DNA-binding protein
MMWKLVVKEWFSFAKNERRGIAVLCALLLIAAGLPVMLRFLTPKYSSNYQELKLRVDSIFPLMPTASKDYKKTFERSDHHALLFYFDPNTISHDSLLLLGFSHKQAASIINYRSHGGFRTAEQFLRLNMVSHHQHLAGYIKIAAKESFPHANTPKNMADSAASMPAHAHAAAAAIIPIDINTADTSMLIALPGIGKYFANQIVQYREKLGGYTNIEQLCEIKYFDHDKLLRLAKRLTIDYSKVKKIPLTKDGIDMLRRHPYVGAYASRGIEQYLRHAGKEEVTLAALVSNNILSQQQADKLSGYIVNSSP